jgi:hypothetical protein
MMEAKGYTFAEMADIHFFYGCANGNAHEARRLYQETFPNHRLSCSRTTSRIAQRLRERGKFIPAFIRTSYVILRGYLHMNVSGYLGTCSLLDPYRWELFCLIRDREQPGEVCDIGFGISCIHILNFPYSISTLTNHHYWTRRVSVPGKYVLLARY